MARPRDPALRAARQLQIIDAGLTAFADHGPGATTAQICQIAGVSSGAFFHHFATKVALLVAILDLSSTETAEFFATQDESSSPRASIHAYVERSVADLADRRAARFILAVAAMASSPEVAAALEEQERTSRRGLLDLLDRAQAAGEARTDLPAERLSQWIMMLEDGLASGVASGHAQAADEAALLHEQVDALLDGRSPPRRP
ncbi:TetR/AcrR family transcriptional regulator [Brachybacterium sp. FME24]|uniref:TetR/AcrR family transcriptional regulator n=1 Tax=Brachybacterium sp. FME24 TaxID=2742605 RepID=UPI00186635BF|nr:TetR/AcrR family transcriptional regulator [Brachybacterium sp. FME24]